MTKLLAFAAARRADRIASLGVLGFRALRYVAQGRAPAGPPIEGLVIEAPGIAERAGWHGSTGLYGFLHLPPGGPRRILVTDPARRFQAAAFEVPVVPDRSALRQALESGEAAPPMAPRPLLRDIALHPAPNAPVPPGETVVHGQVRDAAGRPVALARLALRTLVEGTLRQHIGWSDPDGSFLFRLPGERPDTIAGDPPWPASRELTVHVPTSALAAALARDWHAALPAERDTLDPTAPGVPFVRRRFSLHAPDGALRAGAGGMDPTLQLLGGRHTRWDIELA